MLPLALLDLVVLTQRSWRGLTAAMTQIFVEAATVCLHQHRPDDEVVDLHVERRSATSRSLARVRLRRPRVTEQMLATHDDLREATDRGATGLAVLLAYRELGYEVVRRARTSTGIDYWLSQPGQQAFSARMEVSGILSNPHGVAGRQSSKKKQAEASSGTLLPVVVAIVEFSTPIVSLEVQS